MEIRSYTNFSAQSSIILAKDFVDFPSNPQVGEMVQKDGRIYAYTKIAANYYSWLPISVKQSSFIHTQGVAASTWTIAHNLETVDYGLFVYDTSHNLIMVNHKPIDSNTIEVYLNTAIAGTAVVFAVTDFGASTFSATQLTIGGTVVIDSTGVKVNNEYLGAGIPANLTASLVPTSTTNFVNILSATDTDVQKALDTLDAGFGAINAALDAIITG